MWLESPGTAVLDRSTVPACNDRRVPSVDGIINDRDKPTYRQKAWPSAISSTASPTWINLGLNPDLSGKNAETSVLGCDVFTFRYKKGSSLSFAGVFNCWISEDLQYWRSTLSVFISQEIFHEGWYIVRFNYKYIYFKHFKATGFQMGCKANFSFRSCALNY